MAVTSFNPETKRWLTSYGADAAPGSEHCVSVGHPINGGEFTNYRLGPIVAHNDRGEPLFDEREADVELRPVWNAPAVWVTRAEIDAAKAAETYDGGLVLAGHRFKRTAFGGYRYVETLPVSRSRRLVERVAALNPDAGEIGAGMLRSLIEDAQTALALND